MSLDIDIKDDEVEYFCISSEDVDFSSIIGSIEDLLLDDEFVQMQNEFMDKYWHEFEDSEENKLVYMDIFQEYQQKIEHYIENYLQKNIGGFSMDSFTEELLSRKKELDGEIFEMLFTFTDFLIFKDMFLDYKAMKEGKTSDLSSNISVTKIFSRQQESCQTAPAEKLQCEV